MECTKGKWTVWKPIDRVPPVGEGFWGVYIVDERDNQIAKISRQNSAELIPDANLITAAVNACIEINPDNPQAVADSIKEMYEALKELTDIMEVVIEAPDVAQLDNFTLQPARQALAKAREEKDVTKSS